MDNEFMKRAQWRHRRVQGSRVVVTFAVVLCSAIACSFGVNLDPYFGSAASGADAALQDARSDGAPCCQDSGAATADADATSDATGIDAGVPKNPLLSISTAAEHVCGVRQDGVAVCWGYNGYGQCGNPFADSSIAVPVEKLPNVAQISAGYLYTCATLRSGEIACWGYNGNGQLGNGSTTGSNAPTFVPGITDAVSVVSMFGAACGACERSVISASAPRSWFGRRC
jgi:Regulator of chromosome condensation (RCC1) repeat